MLLEAVRDRYSMAVFTNGIYTKEDTLILSRHQAHVRGPPLRLCRYAAARPRPAVPPYSAPARDTCPASAGTNASTVRAGSTTV